MQKFLQFFYRHGIRSFRGGQIRMLLVQCGRPLEGFRASQTETCGVIWAHRTKCRKPLDDRTADEVDS